MKRAVFTTAIALGLTAASAIAEPINLQPGQWKYTITMTMHGTGLDPIIESESDCMGEWESKLEPAALAQEFAGGADCQATNVNQTANMVSFKMICPGEAMHNAKLTLTHQYSSFAMDGDLLIPVSDGRTILADMKVIANRTGACTN